jgi:bifunctional non-homologous end joining protein LigD
VKLYSRSGCEWTRRLPVLGETLRALPCHSAVLDGELCLPGPGGAPDFRGLQGRWALGARLAVFVFDLLRRDEDDLTEVPLSQRKQLLMSVATSPASTRSRLSRMAPSSWKLPSGMGLRASFRSA